MFAKKLPLTAMNSVFGHAAWAELLVHRRGALFLVRAVTIPPANAYYMPAFMPTN
ncbi:hypothetical protein [uncultured Ruegeria sp.]|uniref:hypothetical protein n=1 Tax=uncultured Ruegeria sp. TaxID=259304 RepID=UPI002625ECFD|nr:hypothetical protein [uncultured Ruegeria sp.]